MILLAQPNNITGSHEDDAFPSMATAVGFRTVPLC